MSLHFEEYYILIMEKGLVPNKNVLDRKGYGKPVVIHLFKASDTLNHDLRIATLHIYGFSEQSLLSKLMNHDINNVE